MEKPRKLARSGMDLRSQAAAGMGVLTVTTNQGDSSSMRELASALSSCSSIGFFKVSIGSRFTDHADPSMPSEVGFTLAMFTLSLVMAGTR